MCGIAGVIASNFNQEQLIEFASSMADKIAHRGPDSNGVWSAPNLSIALSHRRLAILDLSTNGHQPMCSRSGRFVIVFNGEVYNFKSIKSRLESIGHEFYGHSDTEVLLTAIECWGIDEALSECKGMFAFALLDQQEKVLLLARDRVGEKPLYYGLHDQKFVFGSELKALFPNSLSRPKIDLQALSSYLRYSYVSAPQSIYSGIRKVEPGSYVKIDLKSVVESLDDLDTVYYWRLIDIARSGRDNLITNEDAARDQLDELLNTIISEQALADVPLGAFLSGGIDSSAVAGILQSQSSTPIDTFTIGFHDKSFDEALHAKAVAKHIQSNHHELYLDAKNILDTVPLLANLYDEPFADASQIPMFLVSQLAKKDVTVCLSGDGGDELFGGYNRYTQTTSFIDKGRRLPVFARKLITSAILNVSPKSWDHLYSQTNSLLMRKGGANTGLKLHKIGMLLNIDNYLDAYRYLSSYWENPHEILVAPVDERTLDIDMDFEKNFLDAAMLWDQKWYLPGDNLVKTDRASMGASLEMRLPLLDARLIEFSWRLSNTMKIKQGKSKWILRETLYKYVPKYLIERPKMGFSVPIADWINKDLREFSEALLSHEFIKAQNIFNYDAISRIYQQHQNGTHNHSNKLWTILMFQAWYKNNF